MGYLKRKLREAGPGQWEPIAIECGVSRSLPRKLAYDDRENPRIQTVQPLLDFFHAQDVAGRAKDVAHG